MALADHLQAPRQHGLFHHHGIDLGDGTVAHYLEGRAILRSTREEFSRGQPISTVIYPEGSCSAADVTVRRAMGRLGEQNYNLLFNNCEHFAHWCKTGRHRSPQVEDWLHRGGRGAWAAGQVISGALITGASLLLRQGLPIEAEQMRKGRDLARRSLEQLNDLRQNLRKRLEEDLARVDDRWTTSHQPGDPVVQLRVAAQNLADQLSQVEELEARLEAMLNTGVVAGDPWPTAPPGGTPPTAGKPPSGRSPSD